MLTELLRPRGDSNVGQTQKIEVLNNEDDADGDDDIDDNDEQWYYKQELPEDKPDVAVDLGAAQDAGRTFFFMGTFKTAWLYSASPCLVDPLY